MKRLTFIFVLLPLFAFSQSDANLVGHVIDKETGKHIPFARIVLKGSTLNVACDATGHYFLKNITPGTYTVQVHFMGYQAKEQVVNLEAGVTKELNFSIEPSSTELDELVVSANRNQTLRREAPVVVGVMNRELFEITNSCNLAQGLNFQPGLRVENNCQNCGFQQVRINGLEGPYSQILIDSRPIFSSLAGVYGIEQIPASMIDRVEVVRGGGSALFGSNAIGGTINIITKEPVNNTFSISNTLTLIDNSSMDNIVNLGSSLITDNQKAGIYLFGMFHDRKAWDANDDGFSEIGKLNSETFGFRSYFRPSDYSKINIEYHRINEYRRGGDSLRLQPHEVEIAEMAQHRINGGGISYLLFSKNHKHTLNLYTSVQHTVRNSYYGTNKNPDAYGRTDDLTTASGAQYSFNMDKLLFMPAQLTVGTEYNYDDLNDEMLGYNRILAQTTRIVGGYVQNEWKSKQLSILLGARVDKHNLVDDVIVSPRINLRYAPASSINLRASYSSGYRAPQTFDEDLHVAAVGGEVALISNAENLTPEYSHSYSASADYTFKLGSWGGNMLFDGFYTRLDDVFVLEEVGTDKNGNQLKERRNGSGAIVKGVNVEAKLIPASWMELQSGFTLQRSCYKEPEQWSEDENVEPTERLLRTPDAYGYFTSSFKPTKQLFFSVSGIYTGSMVVPHFAGFIEKSELKKTSDFFDLSFKVGYLFKLNSTLVLELNAGVQNIFNSFQKDFDKGADRDSGYVYGPSIPQSIFFGVKLGVF